MEWRGVVRTQGVHGDLFSQRDCADLGPSGQLPEIITSSILRILFPSYKALDISEVGSALTRCDFSPGNVLYRQRHALENRASIVMPREGI